MTNPLVPLAEIVEELENGSRPEGGVDDSGDVFSVGGEHLNDFGEFDFSSVKLITHDFYQQMKRGKVKPNDIIIVKDGATTGKTSFVTDRFPHFPCAINEHVFRLSVKQTVADSRYVFYYLYSPKGNREILDDFRGATVGGISQEFVSKVFIPLPPLPEQRRIADLLTRADRLRRLRRVGDSLSASLLQSVFLEMFGDPVRNEKGWERASIAELGKVQTGNTPSREEPENFGDFSEWIKSDNILDDRLYISQSWEMLSEIGLKKGRSVNAGTVLMTCIAGSLSHIGDVAITNRKVSFNQQINAISPNPDVNSLFLYGMFNIAKPYVQYNATAGMKHIIIKSKLEELVLIKPPLPQQEQFAAVVRRVEFLRGRAGESARQGEGLFQSLLNQAFSN